MSLRNTLGMLCQSLNNPVWQSHAKKMYRYSSSAGLWCFAGTKQNQSENHVAWQKREWCLVIRILPKYTNCFRETKAAHFLQWVCDTIIPIRTGPWQENKYPAESYLLSTSQSDFASSSGRYYELPSPFLHTLHLHDKLHPKMIPIFLNYQIQTLWA